MWGSHWKHFTLRIFLRENVILFNNPTLFCCSCCLFEFSGMFPECFRNVFGFSFFTHPMSFPLPPAENAAVFSILSARHYWIPIDEIDEALSVTPTAASWMEPNPIVYGSNLLILFLFLLLLKYTCMLFRWNVNRRTVFKIHISWVEILYASISSFVRGRTGVLLFWGLAPLLFSGSINLTLL